MQVQSRRNTFTQDQRRHFKESKSDIQWRILFPRETKWPTGLGTKRNFNVKFYYSFFYLYAYSFIDSKEKYNGLSKKKKDKFYAMKRTKGIL